MSTKSTTPDISSSGHSMPAHTTPKPTMQKTTIPDRETTKPTILVLNTHPPSTEPPASKINIHNELRESEKFGTLESLKGEIFFHNYTRSQRKVEQLEPF